MSRGVGSEGPGAEGPASVGWAKVISWPNDRSKPASGWKESSCWAREEAMAGALAAAMILAVVSSIRPRDSLSRTLCLLAAHSVGSGQLVYW